MGSPKFPSYPFWYMPCSQTPVVSCLLALSRPGLLPSTACKASAFLPCFVGKLSYCPRLYIFRGSIARPTPLFPPAPYSRYRVCTWGSLLTCWLGFGQVGLESSPDPHPLGNISRFPEFYLLPNASSLSWREHALVRPRSRSAPLDCPFIMYDTN